MIFEHSEDLANVHDRKIMQQKYVHYKHIL